MKTRNTTFTAILIIISLLNFVTTANSLAQITGQVPPDGTVYAGTVIDSDTDDPVPLAHVAFFDTSATVLLAGTITDFDGKFTLKLSKPDAGTLRISYIGYETRYLTITPDVASDGIGTPGAVPAHDLSRILLTPITLMHDDVVVYGEQVRLRTDADRVSWFPHEAMLAAANSGTDLLRFIPGIQVDIMQQVSLDGSYQIVILVDGMERDRHYIRQIRADRIERIEVMPTPPAAYSANAAGVINIVLKQRRNHDMSGHLHLELPASPNEIYLFPSYSLHYGAGRVGFFTSYSGELSYFDIRDVHTRTYSGTTGGIPGHSINSIATSGNDGISQPRSITWQTVQHVRQENWSHRFNFGMDFQPATGHSLTLFAWFHPWSREHGGHAELHNLSTGEIPWSARKSDDDRNTGRFGALTYRFAPGENNDAHHITADISYYALSAGNSTVYHNSESGYYRASIMKPGQQNVQGRLDIEQPVGSSITIGTGISFRNQLSEDRIPGGFRQTDQTGAAYTTIGYRYGFLDVQAGLRTERVWQGGADRNGSRGWMWFPNASAGYRFSGAARTLRLTYRRSVQYPHLYQLNPVEHAYDPMYQNAGNPALQPGIRSTVHLEYARGRGNSAALVRLYYDHRDHAIQDIGFIDESGRFVAQMQNAGELHRYGVQISGTVSIGAASGLQPLLNIYRTIARANEYATKHGVADRTSAGWSGGLSAYSVLPAGITVSAIINYSGRDHGLQRSRYSGTLYFLSVEKAFGSKLKAGITSALPFARTVVYDGYEIDQPGYRSRSEGSILMSAVPVWVKLNYSFSSANRRQIITRSDDPQHILPRKGF
jgi:hypothetical protein